MVKHGPKEKELSQRQFRDWYKAEKKATAGPKPIVIPPTEPKKSEPKSKRLLPPAKKAGGRRNPILIPPTPSQTRRIREATKKGSDDGPRSLRSPTSPRRAKVSLFEKLGSAAARDGAQIIREIAERRAQLLGQLTTPPQSYSNLYAPFQSLDSVMDIMATATSSTIVSPSLSITSSHQMLLDESNESELLSHEACHPGIAHEAILSAEAQARLTHIRNVFTYRAHDISPTILAGTSINAATTPKTPERSEHRYFLVTPPATEQRVSPTVFQASWPSQDAFVATLINSDADDLMLLTRSSTPVRAGRSEEILGSPMSVARPFRLATAFEQHSIANGSIPSISVSNCQGRSNARDNTALWTLYRDAASPYSDTSSEEKSCDVLPSLGSPLTTGPLQEDKDGLSRNLLTPKIVSGNELVTNDTSSNCKDALCKETESKSSVNDTLLRSEDPYTPVKIPKHPVLQVLHNSEMSINQPFMSWTQRSRMLSVPFNAPTRQFLQAPNDIGSMLASSRHPRGQTEPPSCRESKTSIPSGHFATRPSTSMEFGSFISKQNWPTVRNSVSATSHESNSRISSMVRLDALFRYVPVSAAISRTPEKLRARRQSQSRASPPPLTASVSIPLPGQQQMSSSDETLSLEDASKPVTPLQSPVRFHTAVRHVGSPVSEQRAYGIEIPSPGAYSKVSNEETVLEKFGKDRRGSRLAIWRWWAATESSRPLDIEAGRSFVHRDSEADHETLYGKLKKFLNAGPFAA